MGQEAADGQRRPGIAEGDLGTGWIEHLRELSFPVFTWFSTWNFGEQEGPKRTEKLPLPPLSPKKKSAGVQPIMK